MLRSNGKGDVYATSTPNVAQFAASSMPTTPAKFKNKTMEELSKMDDDDQLEYATHQVDYFYLKS